MKTWFFVDARLRRDGKVYFTCGIEDRWNRLAGCWLLVAVERCF